MDIAKRYATSKKLETDGIWHELGDGAAIKVARWNNRRFNEIKRQLERKHRAEMKGGRMPDELGEKIIIEAIANAILLDWRGLEINGVKLPAYTPEEGVRVLSDTEQLNMGEFRDTIAAVSMDTNNFRTEHEAEAIKN